MSIEAMKLALDALETHGAPLLNHEDVYSASLNALRQAIADAEKQEPDDLTIAYMTGFHAGKNTPQREWVGLTYLEIDQIYCDCHDDDGRPLSIKKYERAIEAKLREKNT